MTKKNVFFKVAGEVAYDIGCQALSTAVCSYVARKINYLIDRQEQTKMLEEVQVPAPKRRIGFRLDELNLTPDQEE